jgi:transposase
VLLADEGRHAPEIAWLVRRGPHQVRKVLRRFQAEGLAGLVPRTAPGRAVQVPPSWLAELQRVIDLDPHAGASASAGLRLQAPDLESQTQVDRASGLGKKRLKVEALLAAAASPVPPPVADLMPDPLLVDEVPEDLPWLLRVLPRADLYLQDEVEIALHPTLTRVWCPKGRRGQRLVEAPGNNAKEYGFGLVDWRDGWFDWQRAPGRRAVPFCAQLRRAVERSQARGRIALVLLDNLGIHTPRGSLKLRELLDELRGQLVLVYTPAYDPEANRIEWLWRALRRAVTHTHTRETLPPLLEDADSWARTISPLDILRQIGSPFADADLTHDQDLAHAA